MNIGAYVESHGLFGPGLLHLVVHDGVVDAKATEDHKGLKHTTLLLHSQGHGTPKQGDMFDVITDKQLVHTLTHTHAHTCSTYAHHAKQKSYLEQSLVCIVKLVTIQPVEHLSHTCNNRHQDH